MKPVRKSFDVERNYKNTILLCIDIQGFAAKVIMGNESTEYPSSSVDIM